MFFNQQILQFKGTSLIEMLGHRMTGLGPLVSFQNPHLYDGFVHFIVSLKGLSSSCVSQSYLFKIIW